MTTVSKNFQEWVLSNIDFEGYNFDCVKNKIETGLKVFRSEYDFEIKRRGEQGAFKEYLLGLPGWLNIPFYYYDIRNLLYSLGYEVDKLDDSDLCTMYYQMITNVFFK